MISESTTTAELPRLSDRAQYVAALAVGLATAQVSDAHAVAELRAACHDRHGEAVAARRRLYASCLGSSDNRREAARLLDRVCDQTRPWPPRGTA